MTPINKLLTFLDITVLMGARHALKAVVVPLKNNNLLLCLLSSPCYTRDRLIHLNLRFRSLLLNCLQDMCCFPWTLYLFCTTIRVVWTNCFFNSQTPKITRLFRFLTLLDSQSAWTNNIAWRIITHVTIKFSKNFDSQ